MLGVGYAVSGKIKTEQHKEAGEIVSASIYFSAVVALGNGVVYGATNLLPLFIAKGPADAAADYFNASLIGVLPALFTVPLGVFFAVTGNGKSAFAAKGLYRIGSSALAYLLVEEYSTAASVGYANGIAPWAAAVFTIMILRQEQFKKYQLGNITKMRANYAKHGESLIKNGKSTAYLRLTEWINLALIALFFHPSIAPMNASIQYLTLANLIVQGIGFGAGMHAKGNRKKMTALQEVFDYGFGDVSEVQALHRENIESIQKCLAVAIIISCGATWAAFAYNNEICDLFLHEDEPAAVKDSAKNILQINAIGLPFDAVRMVLGSSLNGYNEMMFQSNNALVFMTGVGVVLAFVVQQAHDYPIEYLFWLRNATILASAVLNGCKLLSKIRDDVDTFGLEGVTRYGMGVAGNKQAFGYSQAEDGDDDDYNWRSGFHTAV